MNQRLNHTNTCMMLTTAIRAVTTIMARSIMSIIMNMNMSITTMSTAACVGSWCSSSPQRCCWRLRC